MNRTAQLFFFFSLSSLFLVLGGCGSGKPTGYVSGNVTLPNGNDPAGLLVRFMNESDGVGATAVVQPDSSYSLKFKGESGVPVGKFKVAVTAQVKQMSDLEVVEFMKLSGPEQRKFEAERRSKSKLVPTKYRSTQTTDLSYEIVSGSQEFDIVIDDGMTIDQSSNSAEDAQ